jgi:predicted extracellular nuclease
MKKHFIYWWNLENLFDSEDSPDRPEWLQKSLAAELKGWNSQVLDKKISNLCSIIKQFNNSTGPDIMGVCEIENERVVKLLADKIGLATGRSYKVLHKDTKDERGIDIAFFYDSKKYIDDGQLFSFEVMKRNATRDLIQVHLTSIEGKHELVLVGNHWPARLDGKYESEPYRIMVAETLSYWVERICEEKGNNVEIVLMGDFNDNPYDRSIVDYLMASNSSKLVENAKNHMFLNLMYPFLGQGTGTQVYGGEINILDQFMVSKTIASQKLKSNFKVESTNIIAFPEMVKGRYGEAVRFSRPSENSFNDKGFSDHLPIELVLTEK